MTANVHKVYFGGIEHILKLHCANDCTTLNTLKTTELILWYVK